MAQQHLDRLTAVDVAFLHQESATAHMHVGGLLVFEGSAPNFSQVLDHVRERLHLVPRYRQKLATAPGAGRPFWVDDPEFRLERHAQRATLPHPGTEAQLLQLTARIVSKPLDRAHPLWELWLVDGIGAASGSALPRFAMISKTHHAMVDGIASVDLATVLLDLVPEPTRVDVSALHPWQPRPQPGSLELVRAGARGLIGAGARATMKATDTATQPRRNVRRLRDVGRGIGAITQALLEPAPQSLLNVEIGPDRRFTVARHSLTDYKQVGAAFGATINDVVLSVIAGALREWLHERNQDTDGVTIRALVPVSARRSDQRHDLGNQVSVMRGPLPVGIADPVARLRAVSSAMDGVKRSKQDVGAAALAALGGIAPPAILAQALRLRFFSQLFNLLVTNLPGPQVPLYILGRRLQDLFPIPVLPDGHALSIGIISYDGRMEYGLLGDFGALADLELVAAAIDASLSELVVAADRTGLGSDAATCGD